MLCRQCGTEIAEKALICYRCGTATTEAQFKPVTTSGRRSPKLPVIIVIVLGLLIALFAILLMLGQSG